jgi:hypothetical protein
MASTRYELRKTVSGWTVWDAATGAPATVDGVWQVGPEIQTADDLTDSLNWLEDRAPATT